MTVASAVADAYRHGPKSAVARDPLVANGAFLKWYDIADAETPVPADMEAEARSFLTMKLDHVRIAQDGDAGFVILHRCGDSFYFLLLQFWRGSNELWEAVYAKDGSADFADFAPAYPSAGTIRPTFCVWELGVVAHEAQAWARFLTSPRDAADLDRWRRDLFDGAV